MAIFISYSQSDSAFVDSLAANLVRARHHIWLDRWELKLGDSLTSKIEESLTDSSAILVILSKKSVESQWCRRELTAGLVRELEEKRTLVMPVVIEDCEIPLFLRDKLYADFRKDPDQAFSLIDRSLAQYSNPTTSRVDSPNFHTDFSVVWKPKHIKNSEETWIVRWTFVDHGPNLPYVVVSECKIYEANGSAYSNALKNDSVMIFIRNLANALYDKYLSHGKLDALIDDNREQFDAWKFSLNEGQDFLAIYSYRRLGLDNGMDTAIYPDNNIRMARDHLQNTVR